MKTHSPTDAGRWMLVAGALAALLAVATGAFGSHGLRGRLTPDMLAVFETGVRYHFYHALALVGCGLAAPRLAGGPIQLAGILFLGGIIAFSGSLYALTLSGVRALGMITPFGGTAWILAWLLFAIAAGKRP